VTFLQPFILFALPVILLPVIIHLINRMRHRPQPWAAMRFLLTATRSSTGHAKLRQFLILLFRVLAVLMLVLFLARPLAGGWLGWALAPAPDVILILLDRSASMETQTAGTGQSRREQALKLLGDAAREFEETSHLVLIDSALRAPQQLAGAASLGTVSLSTATDTAADIPALFQAALNWVIENRAGTAEFWVASDLQRSNWKPEDSRWTALLAQMSALPQKVRIRLLALNQPGPENTSLALQEVYRRDRGGQGELNWVVDLQRASGAAGPLSLEVNLDGLTTPLQVELEGQSMRWRNKVSLGERKTGWGAVRIPADANARDNAAYFVYGPEASLQATVVSGEDQVSRILRMAAAVVREGVRRPGAVIHPERAAAAAWSDSTLLIWQAPLPVDAAAEAVRSFAEEGGVVIFFPPGEPAAQSFAGVSWGEVQEASEQPFVIGRWDSAQGPLAATEEGFNLPVGQVKFLRRQEMSGPKQVLAAFVDGMPWLARQSMGKGDVYFCGTLPRSDWSSLVDGPVLVPMLQRLLQSGARRVQVTDSYYCGEINPAEAQRRWAPVHPEGNKEPQLQAGVYRIGDRLVAVNRPVAEDEIEMMEAASARLLFGGLPVQLFQEQAGENQQLQGEVWRALLVAMLLFLFAEGLLILPPRAVAEPGAKAQTMAGPPRPSESVA
jgi:hypothetical protein